MMAIMTRVNQYRGLNAHFQSDMQTVMTRRERAQQANDWVSFHANYLVNVADALNDILPDGYIARPEKSLQISLEDPDSDDALDHAAPMTSPTVVFSRLAELYPEMPHKPPIAVVIYADDDPITRIELLSPANKPPKGSYRHTYQANRDLTILSEQALIELDYLHESYPVIRKLPRYPRQNHAYPYQIIVSNPRQTAAVGQVQVFGFHVDDPVPVVGVPLLKDDLLPFDFGEVYHTTFRRGRWGHRTDYSQLPPRLETYSDEDQLRIRQRMAMVQAAQAQGLDLEKGHFDESVLVK